MVKLPAQEARMSCKTSYGWVHGSHIGLLAGVPWGPSESAKTGPPSEMVIWVVWGGGQGLPFYDF